MNTSGTEGMDQDADGPGLFGRYVRVFISPDSLFQGLRRRPVWVGAMLLGGCLVSAGTVLMPPELTLATLRERALELRTSSPPGLGRSDGAVSFRRRGRGLRLLGRAAHDFRWAGHALFRIPVGSRGDFPAVSHCDGP